MFEFLEVKSSIYLNRHVFVMLVLQGKQNLFVFGYLSDTLFCVSSLGMIWNAIDVIKKKKK